MKRLLAPFLLLLVCVCASQIIPDYHPPPELLISSTACTAYTETTSPDQNPSLDSTTNTNSTDTKDRIIHPEKKAKKSDDSSLPAVSFCVYAIDRDTINLDNGESVRLIGVDTNETVHPSIPVEYFGRVAHAFASSLVTGSIVRLEYDQTKRDKYGRLLAYVCLPDGTFVNAQIVKHGYGFAYTKYLFTYTEEFRAYEKAAREKGLELLAGGYSYFGVSPAYAESFGDDDIVYITRTGECYHRDGCGYLKHSKIPITRREAIEQGYRACSRCNP